MNHATDTPRTDAEITRVGIDGDGDAYLHAEFARELERELKASGEESESRRQSLAFALNEVKKTESEVEKLNHQLLKTENDLLQSQDINSFLDTEFRIACKRAERAEAEVERLREQLESTKLLALKFWNVLEENGFKIELPK
jgi:predicted  nucleic acid-binding Zn-ribbon protein